MPISVAWDARRRIWTVTTAGTFDLEEVSQLLVGTDWKGSTLYLWDLRSVTRGPDSAAELRHAAQLVERGHKQWAGSRVAIVVARDVDFGMARMFQVFAEDAGVEFEVFRELEAALDWLGSPPAP